MCRLCEAWKRLRFDRSTYVSQLPADIVESMIVNRYIMPQCPGLVFPFQGSYPLWLNFDSVPAQPNSYCNGVQPDSDPTKVGPKSFFATFDKVAKAITLHLPTPVVVPIPAISVCDVFAITVNGVPEVVIVENVHSYRTHGITGTASRLNLPAILAGLPANGPGGFSPLCALIAKGDLLMHADLDEKPSAWLDNDGNIIPYGRNIAVDPTRRYLLRG